MTTGIISLVLLVWVFIVMYFVMKIYSVLRGFERSFYPVHSIEMDATKWTEVHGEVVQTSVGGRLITRDRGNCRFRWNIVTSSLFKRKEKKLPKEAERLLSLFFHCVQFFTPRSSFQHHLPSMPKIHSLPLIFTGSFAVVNGDYLRSILGITCGTVQLKVLKFSRNISLL